MGGKCRGLRVHLGPTRSVHLHRVHRGTWQTFLGMSTENKQTAPDFATTQTSGASRGLPTVLHRIRVTDWCERQKSCNEEFGENEQSQSHRWCVRQFHHFRIP